MKKLEYWISDLAYKQESVLDILAFALLIFGITSVFGMIMIAFIYFWYITIPASIVFLIVRFIKWNEKQEKKNDE